MSCFCASNSSGDSVYSGYFRWRMGLPLPPIPQEEETNILQYTNKEILNEIVGVRNVNDVATVDVTVDETSRRLRRRKNNQSINNSADRFCVPSSNPKHFRENPIYINSVSQKTTTESSPTLNSTFQFCPIKDEIFVPSKFESFFVDFGGKIDPNYCNTKFSGFEESISMFLVNKFLSNIQEYSDSFSNDCSAPGNEPVTNDNPESNVLESITNSIATTVPNIGDILPPVVPPHRKPSTIFEESDSEIETVKSGAETMDNEGMDMIEPLCNETDRTTTSIPIYSIKHGDIDRIISEGMSDYDYAYNKSWSKGVELNFSMNLTEHKRSRRRLHLTNKNKPLKVIDVDTMKEECTVESTSKAVSDQSTVFLTDETDDSTQVNSLPQTSPIPFLKLSSIEADALVPSSTKLPRQNHLSGSMAESETDSRNEPWDVIHGRFVKELTGSRFIDLSVINNNKSLLTKTSSIDDSKVNIIANQRNTTLTLGLETKKSRDSFRKLHVNINPTIPLDKQPWYHFYLTRSKSEALLANHKNGSFLVRRSESNKNDYSLTIKHSGVILHMKITRTEKGFVLGEYSQPYQSIPQMLYHYCLTMVPVKGAEAACLKFAVMKDHN